MLSYQAIGAEHAMQAGAGPDERALEGHAGRDDVQEAPDGQAGRECEHGEGRIHLTHYRRTRRKVDGLARTQVDDCFQKSGVKASLGLENLVGLARIAGGTGDRLDDPHRRSAQAAHRARARHLAADERLDRLPEERRADDGVGQAREPVEGDLRAPGGRELRRQRAAELAVVRPEIAGEDGVGRELRREERLVDAVARERVDEARGIAEQRRAASGYRARA